MTAKTQSTGADKLTIQELNKMQQDKEIAAETMKQRCKICFRETAPTPRCFGHGGPGGGGESGSEQKTDRSGDTGTRTLNSDQIMNTTIQTDQAALQPMSSSDLVAEHSPLNEKGFNPEIISDLLSKRILVIDNDSEKGILTIKLQCSPSHLSKEQRDELEKYIDVILKQLDAFKKEKGISTQCATIEEDKNGNIISLRIMLPTPTIYNAFIQMLANENLLPMQNINQRENENVIYPEHKNHFNPTPLTMEPAKGKHKKEELQDSIYNKEESSIRPGSPLDGPKPKGWTEQ